MISPEDLRNLSVAIVGAAREGAALAQYLVRSGARVTLHDARPETALARRLTELQPLGLRLALGWAPPDLLDVDILFLSPGVPPSAPLVQQARQRGVPMSSEPRLFIQSCVAPIVGITGSSGKTTTTSLTGRMYVVAGKTTWVGGNIGVPLTEHLLQSGQPDVAVMELSSFQLELFSPHYQAADVERRRSAASRAVSIEGWSPAIAAVTNITPNHLDRHPSMDEYVQAKANIVAFQAARDTAALNLDDALSRGLAVLAPGRVLYFSLTQIVEEGAFVRGDSMVVRFNGHESAIGRIGETKLRGMHNIMNILAASCCAVAGGVEAEAIREVATTFAGVPHRLELVRVWRGASFVNDSIATSPERAIAALRAYDEPLLLLAGGRDKHLPWGEWADLVLERVRVVIAFGEAIRIIEQALSEARGRRGGTRDAPLFRVADSLDQAVLTAAELVRSGDVVLLSPGGTSFDAFEDFEARGQRFRDLVAALE
jgi:UDP-N-acetylmuramoylalanine--D-glutamate ligase